MCSLCEVIVNSRLTTHLCNDVMRAVRRASLISKKRCSITMRIGAWQTGLQRAVHNHGRGITLSQKRACPLGTSAQPSRGATTHTSQQSSVSAAAVADDSDVVAGDASYVSSSSLLMLLSAVRHSTSV